jgi:hypothetical protein
MVQTMFHRIAMEPTVVPERNQAKQLESNVY